MRKLYVPVGFFLLNNAFKLQLKKGHLIKKKGQPKYRMEE
jgi:hypothetical protein